MLFCELQSERNNVRGGGLYDLLGCVFKCSLTSLSTLAQPLLCEKQTNKQESVSMRGLTNVVRWVL